MKIAIFCFSQGGIFHYASQLVNALAKSGEHEVLFFTSKRNPLELLDASPHLKIVALDAPHDLSKFFGWVLNIAQQRAISFELKQFAPDVVHITDTYPLYPLRALVLKKYPLLFTQHDSTPHKGEKHAGAIRFIHSVLHKLADAIVVHGETLKNELVSEGMKAEKISVISHGDYSFFLRWKRESIQKIPNSILFFGRILPYKGLDLLLQSAKILLDRGVDFHLLIAGKGDLSPYQALISALPKEKLTIDQRFIPDEEVIEWFQKAEVLALPYHEATQTGLVPIAFPAEVPVVATNVGAFGEVLSNEENSLLIEPNNSEEFANALEQILTDENLKKRLIEGGKETVRKKIGWSIISKHYLSIYQKMITS